MSDVQTDIGQIPRTNPEWEIQETPGCEKLVTLESRLDLCFVSPVFVFKAYLLHLHLFVTLILTPINYNCHPYRTALL